MRICCLCILLLGLSASTLPAATISVAADGTGDYPTIQAAIVAAANGDEVVLAPGTYTGDGNRDVDTLGKALTIRGTDPQDPAVVAATVIDAQGTDADPHRGFGVTGLYRAAFTISGLTITGGGGVDTGGGILVTGKNEVTIDRCVIKRCRANFGGGLYLSGIHTVRNCTVTLNSAYKGAGIYCGGRVTLADTRITGNTAEWSGGGLYMSGTCTISRCTFDTNGAPHGGSHLYCVGSSTTNVAADNCVFLRNHGFYDDVYSYGVSLGTGCQAGFSHCTFAAMSYGIDSPPDGVLRSFDHCIIWCDRNNLNTQNTAVTWCDIRGGFDGTGNIDVDPRLTVDGQLLPDSPCINAGDPLFAPSGVPSDIHALPRVSGGRVDIGADEFLDTDADSLPDWYELTCTDSTTAAEPDADPQGIGISNRYRFRLGLPPVTGQVLYVDPAAGSDDWDGLSATVNPIHGPKATIAAAIDAAEIGATIVLQPGTYTGPGNRDLEVPFKALTIRGSDPTDPAVAAATVIDCQGTEADPHQALRLMPRSLAVDTMPTNRSLALSGFAIRNGSASGAGAIDSRDGGLAITFCTFSDNASTGEWGLVGNGGGAIRSSGLLVARESEFFDNVAAMVGGGVFAETEAVFERCTFTRNVADKIGGVGYQQGGALYLTGPVIIRDCLFDANGATYGGGSIYGRSSTRITRCRILRSHGQGILSAAGTMDLQDCIIAYCSGAIYKYTGALSLTNCTLQDNGGPSIYGMGQPFDLTLTNCIVWGMQPDQIGEDAQVTATHCIIRGGAPGEGNLDVDPLLTHDGHLTATSPAIDAGDPAFVAEPGETDIDGQFRVTGGRVDIGADEWTIPGDANGDDRVDAIDLLILAHSFARTAGQAGYDPRANLNHDGCVNVIDLLILANNFQRTR